MVEFQSDSYAQIKLKLVEFHPKIVNDPLFKQSAIIFLLVSSGNGYSLVLTTRSRNLNSHQGQMSFPGGKFDKDMDRGLNDTALRELEEEIGIDSKNIEIIGRLNDLPTTTGYIISPFVGVFTGKIPPTYTINSDEVADLVEIRLGFFLNQTVFQDKVDFEFTYRGYSTMSLYVDYYDKDSAKKFHIWGATAHIIAEFFKIVYNHHLTKSEYSRPPMNLIIEYLQEKKNHSKKI